jgi:hypothetical protein
VSGKGQGEKNKKENEEEKEAKKRNYFRRQRAIGLHNFLQKLDR